MRFLFAWQHADPATRLEGPRGLLEVLRQLQGYEAPAVAWEREILPARLQSYDPAWLDALCLSGEVVWARLAPPPLAVPEDGRPRPRAGLVRHSPIAFLLRQDAEEWMRLGARPEVTPEQLSTAAWAVLRSLRLRGASFLQDLVGRTGLLPEHVERGLGELVAWGLVTADAFSGLRALLSTRARRLRHPLRRGPRARVVGCQAAGRWSLLREPEPDGSRLVPDEAGGTTAAGSGGAPDGLEPARAREDAVERVARQLLARHGVVVRRALEREPLLPPWRELLRVLRRLEMRGEIRGGRFLQGASGEQFGLPEAVELLRSIRRREPVGEPVAVNGGDPLNLTGIVTPGARVAAAPFNRIAYRGGVPVALKEGKEVRFLREIDDPRETAALHAALRVRPGAPRGFEPATLL
jgi:ATP-dependent Lhr-like helicase